MNAPIVVGLNGKRKLLARKRGAVKNRTHQIDSC